MNNVLSLDENVYNVYDGEISARNATSGSSDEDLYEVYHLKPGHFSGKKKYELFMNIFKKLSKFFFFFNLKNSTFIVGSTWATFIHVRFNNKICNNDVNMAQIWFKLAG